jgi:phosphatidylglycerophosphate synthase
VLSVVAALWWFLQPPWHVLALIALREVFQIPLMLLVLLGGQRNRYNYRAAYIGKVATVAQFIALAVLVFRGNAEPWAWLAAIVGLLAVVQYAWRAMQMLRGAP